MRTTFETCIKVAGNWDYVMGLGFKDMAEMRKAASLPAILGGLGLFSDLFRVGHQPLTYYQPALAQEDEITKSDVLSRAINTTRLHMEESCSN